MKLGHQTYTRAELLRHIGNLAQLGGTRHYELTDGRARGIRAIDFDCGSGFRFTVLPDRGLDISLASFNGLNLVYQTPNGEVHPAYYDARGIEWLRIFFAGLLTTCGLTFLGAPGRDGDEDLGIHGRYAATPARQVNDQSAWVGDEYEMKISGVIEECALFLDKIRLTRTVSARLGERSLRIHDRVENFGNKTSPLTILYHINAGFPLLDEDGELVVSASDCLPHSERAARAMERRFQISGPINGFEEENYLYRAAGGADGFARAGLLNRRLALGLAIKSRVGALPFINQWKMMGEGDYVLGIEPCNVPCENRAVLRERGQLEMIEPGEVCEFDVEIGVLVGAEELKAYQAEVESIGNKLKV